MVRGVWKWLTRRFVRPGRRLVTEYRIARVMWLSLKGVRDREVTVWERLSLKIMKIWYSLDIVGLKGRLVGRRAGGWVARIDVRRAVHRPPAIGGGGVRVPLILQIGIWVHPAIVS